MRTGGEAKRTPKEWKEGGKKEDDKSCNVIAGT